MHVFQHRAVTVASTATHRMATVIQGPIESDNLVPALSPACLWLGREAGDLGVFVWPPPLRSRPRTWLLNLDLPVASLLLQADVAGHSEWGLLDVADCRCDNDLRYKPLSEGALEMPKA